MSKKKEEKLELLHKALTQKQCFEEEVLRVFSSQDLEEIFSILAKLLVREKYKEKLNFLYIKQFSSFELSLIKSAVIKEFFQEFVTYGVDVLFLPKEEMIEIASLKENQLFISDLVQEYLKIYRHLIFNEIGNTFIERIVTLLSPNSSDALIEEVLNSPLIKSDTNAIHYTLPQLYKRVVSARDFKQQEKSSLQIKISETREMLANANLDYALATKESEKLFVLEKKLSILEEKSLDNYDAALSRLKTTMLATMQRFNYL